MSLQSIDFELSEKAKEVGVTRMGIDGDSLVVIYKNEAIQVAYNSPDWFKTIDVFEETAKEIVTDWSVLQVIIRELNLGWFGRHKEREKQEDRTNQVLSVSEAIMLTKGLVNVKGIITGKSEHSMVIVATRRTCINCDNKIEIRHQPPLLSIDTRASKRCMNCRDATVSIEYEYMNSIKVRLRDENIFKDIELGVILLGEDTRNIDIGATASVSGEIHVIPVNGRNAKLIPYMFSNSIKYEFKEEITITEDDKKTFERFAGLPEVTERLVSMFAPNVVGENIKKLALLRSIVNAAADKVKPKGSDWSSIVSTIMIGDMGNAKTMLAKETVKVLPNSRYAGSQNSTGLSLTGMIDVENDIKIIRYGPIPLSKYAISEVQPLGFKGDFGPVSYEVVEHRRRSRRTNSFEPTEDPIPLLNGKPDKDLENLLSEHNGILVSVTDDNTEIEEEY